MNLINKQIDIFKPKYVVLLDEETKTDIWNIFHSFVKISICYLHENEVFTEIDKKELAKKWKIKKLL